MRTYTLIKSAPYCCFAASLESVLKRHGICHISQYDIANYLGLVVFKDDIDNVPQLLTNISVTTEPQSVGIHIHNDTLPHLFHRYSLPYQETYISWQEISDWNFQEILQNISSDFDVILYFDIGRLYNEENNYGVGHTGLLISVDEPSTVVLFNPGPRFFGIDKFSTDELVEAIKARQGGLSIIYKT